MALLKLRRGTSLTSTGASAGSEIYFNTTLGTLQVGDNSSTINIVKIGSNTGNLTLLGNLNVAGTSIFTAVTGSNLYLTGNATIDGNLKLGGNIFLGTGSDGDLITVNASLSGSLIPETDSVFDLGSSAYKYKNLYVQSASIDNITLGGSDILSSSLGDYLNFDDYTSSLDSHFSNLDLFTSSQQTINSFYNTFTSSIGGRLDNLELDSSSQDSRLDNLELTTSSFEDRISQLETDSGSQDSRLDNLESTSQSLEGRLDNIESFTSSYFTDSASVDSRLDYLEGSFSSSVDDRLDQLEVHSGSTDSRLDNIEGVSGSYATTGSNLFIGNQTITGSLLVSGAQLQVQGLNFPPQDNVVPFVSTIPYILNTNSGSRTYTGFNFSLSNTTSSIQDVYENSFLLASYGPNGIVDYGSELNVGPIRNHMRVYASGSDSSANISVEDYEDGTTRGLFYADVIRIGGFRGDVIQIGNSGSNINIYGESTIISSPITSSNTVEATFFIGDGSKLSNVTGSYVLYTNIVNKPTLVSGSTQIDVNDTQNFQTFSSSVDGRLDTLEGSFSTSVDSRLNNVESYTSSLKQAIDVNGSDLIVIGNLTVQGTQTSLNTTQVLIEDLVLTLASGSTNGTEANGAGIEIAGANQSITWDNPNTRWSITSEVSASGFIGDGSEIINIQHGNVDFGGSLIVSGSSQVTGTLDLRYLMIDGDNVVSSSSQIDLTQTTNYISGIKTRLDVENVFSSSIQVNADSITNFDTNVKDKLNIDGVISGSTQVQINSVTGFTSYSSSVDSRLVTIETTFSTSVDSRLDNLELDSASQDLRLDNIELTTSSIEDRLDNVESFTSSYFIDSASIDTRLDYLEGDFSTSVDDRLDLLSAISHSHTNKANLDEINQDLATTDSPSFIGLSLTSLLPQPTSSIEFDAVFLSSSNELTYRTLGNAILYNVTSSQDVVLESGSIAYESDNLLTAGAVKKYVDWRTEELVTAIGAADITSVTANAGLSGGGLTGAVTLSLDTGSAHFNDGVVANLVSLNSFTQSYFTDSASIDTRLDGLESFSSSLDSGFVTEAELASATGSLINSIATKLNTGSYNTDSASFDSRLDSLEGETHENPLTFTDTTTINFTRNVDTITADVIGGIVSGSDQLTASLDSRYVNETDFTVFSSSVDSRLDQLQLVSSSQDGRLDNLELFSSSQETKDLTLATYTSSVDGHILDINAYTASNDTTNNTQNSRLDQLSTETGSISLEQSAQDARLSSLELETGSITTEQSVQDSRLSQIESVTSSLASTYEEKASGTHTLVSGSDQLTGSLVDLSSDQTISGTKTFNDIVVNGTGSFAYITSVGGSAKIIGDSYIILNNDTPTQRYAGIAVYDSGSATPTTASLNFDGQTNDWFYEYSASTVDYGVVLFGPEYNTKGNPTYLTNNKIPKSVGTHHLNDSNITDSGTLITLGSNTIVNGTLLSTGTPLVSGSSQINFTELSGISSNIISASSDTAQVDMIITGGSISANLKGGVVSGSSQIDLTATTNYISGIKTRLNAETVISGSSQVTLTGDVTGTANANTVGKIQGVAITSGEATQLANIDTTTISATQWGYLGALNQGLTTTSTVQFGKVGVGGASDATYELKVTGDIGATGDVVAYVSSDRRLKDEIKPIENPLQKINSIGGYSFVWNENQNTYKGKDYGVIAQEIEEILPELVDTRENGYKAVKYDRIVSLLIEGIKELSSEVDELKRKLNT